MADTRDVFISYARPSEEEAHRIAQLLRDKGFSVWRDDEFPAHRAYSDVIEERLKSAKAVVVLWSAESAKSHWVRAEADTAREAGTLVQATLDGALPPMPFNQIQCADLNGWNGDTTSPGWRSSRAALQRWSAGTGEEYASDATADPRAGGTRVHLRPSLRQHEWRAGAGIFQRRDQRGHHNRPVQGFGAGGRRAQHRLRLQGPEPGRQGSGDSS